MIMVKIISTVAFQIAVIIILLFTWSGNLYPQGNGCSFSYENALNLYSAGKIDSAHSTLSRCMENKRMFKKTSKNTRSDIYRLVALSSILLDDPDDASFYIKKMLAINPYYKKSFMPGDILEFKKIVNGFTVQPGISAGINYFESKTNVLLQKAITQHTAAYTPIPSIGEIGIGFYLEKSLTKRISVGLGMNLFDSQINYEGSPIPFNNYRTYYMDFRYIETPVSVNYKLRPEKKITPYFQTAIILRYFTTNDNGMYGLYRVNSPEYGNYYMNHEWDEYGADGVLAVFFNNSENLDFLIGGGVAYNFKRSCIDFNLGYFLPHAGTDPLAGIDNNNAGPEGEWFTWADEIILLDVNRILRFNFSYKYFFNFKAFK